MKNKTTQGITLIIVAVLVATFTIRRDLSWSNIEESGLAVATNTALAAGAVPSLASAIEYPDELSIPKINVVSNVQHLGVTKSGNMQAPDNFSDVSWYKLGVIPGEKGSAVIAGHKNGVYVRGVFRRLNELKVGDSVYVARANGEKLHFKVVETAVYPYDKAPLERIFTASDGTYLNLITCTGTFRKEIGSSDHRLVVYTELVAN